jgi:hypothetical protein
MPAKIDRFSCWPSAAAAASWSWLFFVVGLSCVISNSGNAQDAPFRPPNAEEKITKLRDAGANVVPLFVLGDVNEDGEVDEEDLVLMRNIVRSGKLWPSGAVSCPAAADLKRNGSVDERDVNLLTGWIKQGKIVTPALSYQSFLPCNFKRFFIAANQRTEPGGVSHVRFLEPKLSSNNSTITIESGDADIAASPNGGGYDIITRATAKIGGQVLLKISLPDSRSYFYSLSIGESAK